ncbi:MAG: hypothetical protein Q7J45_00690 [bacterium]|nr:hypothetical protein [bacterium]
MTKRKAPMATPIAAAVGVSQPVGLAATLGAPKMGVKLSSIDTKTMADKGVVMQARDEYGDLVGFSVTIHGSDSERARKAAVQHQREMNEVIAGLQGDPKSAENREIVAVAKLAADIRLVARCTSSIDGLIDDDGEPITYTEANAVALYTHSGTTREQADLFIVRRRNFMPA